jgi:structural maintenance of chromosome 4
MNKRAILKDIVVTDFKSYAGTHRLGPFHPSFTAIVGPNGSGKSNIIDALLFVLGYRARRMRQPKLTDLIHRSAGMEAAPSATVCLHFGRFDPVLEGIDPAYELAVSRTITSSNRSIYQVDGVAVKFEQVETLLRDTLGIDLAHERFLILQGEVESIALMRPKRAAEGDDEGLLEFLEDIIGTNQLIPQIDEAQTTVDALTSATNERLLKFRVAEKHVHSLQTDRDAAEAFLRQENDLAHLKHRLWTAQSKNGQQQVVALTTDLEGIERKLTDGQIKTKEQRAQMAALETQLQAKQQRIADIERQASEALKALSSIEQEDAKLQEVRKHLKTRLKGNQRSNEEQGRVRGELERTLHSLEHEAKVLLSELEDLETSLATEERQLETMTSRLHDQTASLQGKLDSAHKALQPYHEQNRTLTLESEQLETARHSLLDALDSAGDAAQRVNTQLVNCQGQLAEEQLHLQEAIASQALTAHRLLEARADLARGAMDEGRIERDILALETTMAEAQAELSEHASKDGLLAALMRESQRQGWTVHGRLADLGRWPLTHEAAMAVACPALQHVVVPDTATAERCIGHLRGNDLGRASFIVLDKLKTPSRPTTNNGTNRLLDVVECADDFRSAFSFACGETLVCPTLEEATALAFQGKRRERVVTLDGKLIDPSGTMTGGGRTVAAKSNDGNKKKAINAGITREQLEQLESILASKRHDLARLKGRLMELQRSMHTLEREESAQDLAIKKLKISVASLGEQVEHLQKQALSLKKMPKEGDKEAEEAKLKALQADLSKLQARMQALKEQYRRELETQATVEREIMQAGGLELQAQHARVTGLREQSALGKGRLRCLDGDLQQTARQLANASGRDADSKDLQKVVDDLALTDTQIKGKTTEALQIKQLADRLSADLEDAREQGDTLRIDLDDLGRHLRKYHKLEVFSAYCPIIHNQHPVYGGGFRQSCWISGRGPRPN